jgi:hypothetical protein
MTQGSSVRAGRANLATLGWRPMPRWGIQFALARTRDTFPFHSLHSSGFLDQRPTPAPARQTHARRTPLVSRRCLQTTRLPAPPRRRRGRPRPLARTLRTHHHTGRMGEGIETRIESLAEGTRSRLRRPRMAGRLRGFLRESIQSRTGEGGHRPCCPR